ncbi:MAG: ATP-binding cassette domain-containing protein [Gammaproteobacteria bacterium]|nr:ATP-binding cassette domain-containing protein [Gammaproteobacteria bacterium]
MALITLRNLALAFGGPPVLEDINLVIEPGERICLVGRNGCGKSTLLKVVLGAIQPDSGTIERAQGLVVAALAQEVGRDDAGTVFQVVAGGLGDVGETLGAYETLSANLADEADLARLGRLQSELDRHDGWQLRQRVEATLSRLDLAGEPDFTSLSGGMQRRVLLARALVQEPDLLLLDEPTNHLDIEAIQWLEAYLPGYRGAILFVTHDRAFLQALATRIVQIDRGEATSWPGDYANYLRRKEEVLAAEMSAQNRFDKKLAEEEVWIRQGIKARRTRNEGRVRALEKLRRERAARRQQVGKAQLRMEVGAASGKQVIEAEDLCFSRDGRPIIRNFSTLIMRQDRIGIIGPNGCGKTTLIKLLLGALQPDSGSVKQGTRLAPLYLDQLRDSLDPAKSVVDNLGQGSEYVEVGGEQRHVMGYLQDFLFTPETARTPVGALSGGERNRVQLARLFTKPGNLLVLDEPTNDLDVETLELLEELLTDYSGTLLLVSHDRAFLNNLVTSTLVFEGDGLVSEYAGGYDDWLRQRDAPRQQSDVAPKVAKPVAKPTRAKLSYKIQRELEQLPLAVERLEQAIEGLHQKMADPGFFKQGREEVVAAERRLADLEAELAQAYARWEALEGAG